MNRRGVTLIELLVVMAVALLLSATLIAHLAQSSRRRADEVATRSLIAQCELALGRYEREMGSRPPDLVSLLAPRTKSVVSGDPRDPRSLREVTFPPFLVLPKDRISPEGKEILDAWGTPLRYDRASLTRPVWSENVP